MDDDLNNASREKQPGNDNGGRKRIESIPLWLQGISENNADSEKSADGEWLKEQTFVSAEETGPISIEITDQFPAEEEIQDQGEQSVPEEETEFQKNLANWFKEAEPVEKIEEAEIEEIEEELAEEVAPWAARRPDAPGAEAISEEAVEATENEDLPPALPAEEITPEMESDQSSQELELPELDEDRAEPAQDEILPETEEIPDWLRDMIAADEKQQRRAQEQEQRFAALSDEPTQPVAVHSEPDLQDQMFEQAAETLEDKFEETPDPLEEINGESDSEAAPPEFKRSAVLPTANWSRIAGTASQAEAAQPGVEDDAAEEKLDDFVPLQVETPDDAEIIGFGSVPAMPDDPHADFEESRFQPIQFDPLAMENEASQDGLDLAEVEEIESHPDPVAAPLFSDQSGEAPEEEAEKVEANQDALAGEEAFKPGNWEQPVPSEDLETTLPVHTFSATEIALEGAEPAAPPLEMINGVPASLFQAKQILEQGEINPALKVIKTYISQSEYLDEIREWLLSADEKIEKNRASLWEALGDISSHQGNFTAALSSYAKAIELLELSRNKPL